MGRRKAVAVMNLVSPVPCKAEHMHCLVLSAESTVVVSAAEFSVESSSITIFRGAFPPKYKQRGREGGRKEEVECTAVQETSVKGLAGTLTRRPTIRLKRHHARIYVTFVEAIKSINELWCHPIGHLDLLAPFQLRFGGSDCARPKHLIECELTLVLVVIPGMDGGTVGGGVVVSRVDFEKNDATIVRHTVQIIQLNN